MQVAALFGDLQNPVDHQLQFIRMHRFEQIFRCTILHCVDGILDRSIGGQHDHRLILCQGRQQLHPVGIGQLHVGHHQVDALLLEQRLTLRPV